MEMHIGFKAGGERGIAHNGPYDIDDEEFNRLKDDFLAFIEEGKPKGGGYRFRDHAGQPREMLLKFQEIVYID